MIYLPFLDRMNTSSYYEYSQMMIPEIIMDAVLKSTPPLEASFVQYMLHYWATWFL